MFSLPKIILILLIAAAGWYGWRWWQKQQKAKDESARVAGDSPPNLTAEDMVACRVCGTYVPTKGARNCGRADCPY